MRKYCGNAQFLHSFRNVCAQWVYTFFFLKNASAFFSISNMSLSKYVRSKVHIYRAYKNSFWDKLVFVGILVWLSKLGVACSVLEMFFQIIWDFKPWYLLLYIRFIFSVFILFFGFKSCSCIVYVIQITMFPKQMEAINFSDTVALIPFEACQVTKYHD